jgi:hypothetical protein
MAASAFQTRNVGMTKNKNDLRSSSAKPRRAAQRLPNPLLEDWDLWEAALDRDPTLEQRLHEGLYLFAPQPGMDRLH